MTELSYARGSSDVPLLEQTIGVALRNAAARYPDRDAIVSLFQNQRFTYSELDREADRVAAALLSLGVRPGDRVAIWSANRIEWLTAHHGAVRIGAIVVTVNPAFRSEEALYVVGDSGASVLFASPRFRDFSFTQAIEAIGPSLPDLRDVVIFDGAAPAGMRAWDDFLALGSPADMDAVRAFDASIAHMSPCSLQYTSGTTGKPKGALLTHHGILNNGHFVGERQHLTANDRICLPVPFFHCFGIVLGALAALTHGSALVLPGESFDVVSVMNAIKDERCTSLYGVPMMFIAILGHEAFGQADFSTLRTGAIGAAPCPLATMQEVISRMNMREITVVYGMTETSPISFQSLGSDDTDTRVSTVGAPHPHVEAQIIDPNTKQVLPRGATGELCIRGYSVMNGYWQREEATGEAIDNQGWMHSGDLAVMRDDGYVQIVGRLKDTVIRGGENIYPREIEEFLLTLKEVSEAYVFGVPDERYGEELCVWIKLKPGCDVTEAEFRDLCRSRIASYKIPKYIRFVDGFPATASGKVQRFRMRESELAERASATQAA